MKDGDDALRLATQLSQLSSEVGRELTRLVAENEALKAQQPAPQPLTEEMVLRAAKELCRIYAGECEVDEQDTWNIYADQFKRDAKAALAAAHGIKGES